jgi:phenylpropionate dioxygenase-like ring-hydroxylating dioxygenase large terminal subunit
MFARQHWYVIAMSDEVGEHPLGRRVLDEPIVLYRLSDGTAVALADECPHRRYPLSLGRLVDDVLVCNYHGFSFDCTGRCVAVPGQDAIPSRADVRAYPLVERGPWLFVWMGDPQAPDHSRLPDTPWLTDPDWAVLAGMQPLAARHELLVDNLLDLSHETYLHAGFIGTPEVAATPIDTDVDDEAGVVRVSRRMSGAECPPFYSRSTGLQTPIDRWQDIEYHPPGIYILHSRIAPSGVEPGADGLDDPRACHATILYGITPSTATSTYDFWLVARDFATDDSEVDEFMWKMNDEVVRQDVDALTVLEERIAPDPDGAEVSIKIDRGALHARRLLARLVDAERQPEHQSS